LANIKEAIEIYLESTGPAQLAASSLAPRLPEAGLPGSVF
jgi:predicted RNase H-like HicB family nuclease